MSDETETETEIDIDEWLKIEHERLEEFKENYLKGHAKDPEHWPLKMGAGEWDEQFLAYMGILF